MSPQYTMRDICAKLKVSKSTVRNWINAGTFPCGRLHSLRCRRWSEEDLIAYENSLEDRTETAWALKAVADRERAAKAGGASTKKCSEEFWDDVFERRFKPSGLSPEAFATKHCKESSADPISRLHKNGVVRKYAYGTILHEMKKRIRERE